MECRGVLAYCDHRLDEVVVYASTQTPHTIRVALGEILGLEERCIRVVAPDVGGGLGPKARLYPEEIVLAALALELDHPVRWIEERNEHLLTGAHTRDHHYRLTAYADRQGKILGIDCEITVDAGAYGLWPQGPYQEGPVGVAAAKQDDPATDALNTIGAVEDLKDLAKNNTGANNSTPAPQRRPDPSVTLTPSARIRAACGAYLALSAQRQAG